MDCPIYKLLFAMLLAAAACKAQGAIVRGVVTDPLGAVVPHARVEIFSQTGKAAETQTGGDGKYELTVSIAGRYRLVATAPTFAELSTDFFYMGAGEVLQRDLLLKIRERSEEIVVTATGVPVSEAQDGSSVDVLGRRDFVFRLNVMEPLLSLPGVQMGQSGQRGSESSLFIRGGDQNSNKVLLDGAPINDIGGGVDFGNLALTAIDRVELFRGPNVLYGADALAGVVSLETQRGTTRLPEFSFALEGGNFGTHQQDGKIAGAWRRVDYLFDFSRFDTSNSVPNSRFHDATFVENAGWYPNAANSFRVTVHRIASGLGLPNSIEFFGLPDNGQSVSHDTFVSAAYENQATTKWHNVIRYGASRLDNHFDKPSPVGLSPGGVNFFGLPVTIRGANGFMVSGQAFLSSADCCPDLSASTANRDSVYAQTDYRFSSHLVALLGYRYEAERGTTQFVSPAFTSSNSIDRRNTSILAEMHGDFWNRLFYSAAGDFEKNAVFGTEAVPRISLAYYLFRPGSARLFRGTKLKLNAGKAVKEPDIFDETNSLFDLLQQQVPGGAQVAQQFGIKPIGAERSRSYDFGLLQSVGDRASIDVTLFHNEFYDQIEFVSSNELPLLGVPAAVATAIENCAVNGGCFGATVNSLNFSAKGVETALQFKISNSLHARGGYTYLDARVQRSFSNDPLSPPTTNPDFPGIPIGAFSPLVGARPFRRAPHTGYIAITYGTSRWAALLQGTFVGPRDDSTFLLGSDLNGDNTLLLPNRNLDGAYQKLDLSGSFKVNRYATLFASMENLLSERYDTAFGFPALPFTVRSGLRITVGGGR